MTLGEILKVKGSKVWTIKENQPLREALGILVQQKIGALVVLDEKGGVVGIISERDIVRGAFEKGSKLEEAPVKELMTREVIIGSPDDEISYIMGVMTENRVRHIPVVAEGKLQGLVSIGDVVKSEIEGSKYEIHYLKEYIYGRNAS
jgi:CBS domain-containing protein